MNNFISQRGTPRLVLIILGLVHLIGFFIIPYGSLSGYFSSASDFASLFGAGDYYPKNLTGLNAFRQASLIHGEATILMVLFGILPVLGIVILLLNLLGHNRGSLIGSAVASLVALADYGMIIGIGIGDYEYIGYEMNPLCFLFLLVSVAGIVMSVIGMQSKPQTGTQSGGPGNPFQRGPQTPGRPFQQRPQTPGQGQQRPQAPGQFQQGAQNPGQYQQRPKAPGQYQQRPQNPGQFQQRPQSPGQFQQGAQSPGQYQQRPQAPGQFQQGAQAPGQYQQRPQSPGQGQQGPQLLGQKQQGAQSLGQIQFQQPQPQQRPQPLPKTMPLPSNHTPPLKSGRIRAIAVNEYKGAEFSMEDGKPMVIGRDPGKCNIILSSSRVSRVHCEITYNAQNGTYILKDMSANATYFADVQRLGGRLLTMETGEKLLHDTRVVNRGTQLWIDGAVFQLD